MFRGQDGAGTTAGQGMALRWRPGEAALPVAFAGTVGLYTPPAADAVPRASAVLFLSPWGFEEMCIRKLWRLLAERFALLGIASLRFDYPGTGDALDASGEQGLDLWERAAAGAARELRALSGCDRLLVVGQGLGAALAARLGGALDAAAAVLMAPVVSGRFHLRELSAWSKMVDEGLGLRPDQRIAGKVSVAGLVMPDAVAEAVRGLNLESLDTAPFPKALVVERAGREKDAAFSARLAALGVDVARAAYTGYDDLVSNPTLARQPHDVVEAVSAWVRDAAPAGRQAAPAVPRLLPARLAGDGFTEEFLRFGGDGRLFGALCQPAGARRGATILLLGTAYDRQAGWARSTVETARHLARNGVTSLRFDAANVADSPPLPGAPEQVQYSEHQLADAAAAIDLLEARGLAPVLLAGRCSGAYLAFRAALVDRRAAGVVAINPFTFRWDPADSVDEALRTNPRSLEDYRRRAFSSATLRRLLAGEIDLRRALGNVGLQLGRRLAVGAPHTLGRLTRFGRLRAAIHADFRALSQRQVPILLLYSEGDVGLERLRLSFGKAGPGRYGNVTVEIVADADHNLSPPHAQALYRARLLAAACATG